MPDPYSQNRRDFFALAATTLAGAELVAAGSAAAQGNPATGRPAAARSHLSFGPIKQIDAGLLNVGYAEAGPADGPPVILLHGWPYDIHSFVEVAPILASKGYRVLVPYMRGCGATRFGSAETFRNAQQSAVALDATAFMDALKIDKAVIGGFDLGARTADIIAALWPERCKALVSVSGYLIGSPAANKAPLPPAAEYQWWYQQARRGTGDRRAGDHPRRRRQRSAAWASGGLPRQVFGQISAPADRRRRRAQPAAGSTAGLRQSHRGRRQVLTRGRGAFAAHAL
jgi:pimeloyl-ACP methyl ester carboxylesterase